jgi:hypothetical protein
MVYYHQMDTQIQDFLNSDNFVDLKVRTAMKAGLRSICIYKDAADPSQDTIFHYLLYEAPWDSIFLPDSKKFKQLEAMKHQKLTQGVYDYMLAHPQEKVSLREVLKSQMNVTISDNDSMRITEYWILGFLTFFKKINFRKTYTKEWEVSWYNPQKLVKKYDYKLWLNK